MVQDGGLLQCDKVKGVGNTKQSEGTKTEQNKTMRQSELKSEFWGKTSLFFGVDTKVLNTNDK